MQITPVGRAVITGYRDELLTAGRTRRAYESGLKEINGSLNQMPNPQQLSTLVINDASTVSLTYGEIHPFQIISFSVWLYIFKHERFNTSSSYVNLTL